MTTQPHVYVAINGVQSELSQIGITKDRTAQGYKFRGIDDVYNTVSPLLAKHNLCIMPRVLSRSCVERQTKSGSPIFYVTVEVEFDFVSSVDGSKHIAKTFGEAMDTSDKATNKAMSAAYKYVCFQVFAIPTEGDNDADATTHEVRSNTDERKQAALKVAAENMKKATTREEVNRIFNETAKKYELSQAQIDYFQKLKKELLEKLSKEGA